MFHDNGAYNAINKGELLLPIYHKVEKYNALFFVLNQFLQIVYGVADSYDN